MSTKIREPGEKEREAAARIQSKVEDMISTRGLSSADLAARLGLLPEGAQNLRGRSWGLETAWRVAEALGVSIDVQVHTGDGSS